MNIFTQKIELKDDDKINYLLWWLNSKSSELMTYDLPLSHHWGPLRPLTPVAPVELQWLQFGLWLYCAAFRCECGTVWVLKKSFFKRIMQIQYCSLLVCSLQWLLVLKTLCIPEFRVCWVGPVIQDEERSVWPKLIKSQSDHHLQALYGLAKYVTLFLFFWVLGFYVCFLSLVRVFVAVRSREMAATIAISARSTSKKKAARTWQTSPRRGCPARWTYSLPTMTACSAHMSAFGLPCPSTPMRWSSRHLSTRLPTTETGELLVLDCFFI